MRVIKKVGLLSLLAVATLLIQTTSATLTDVLPESSHYQGSTYYDKDTGHGWLTGRIDFAVYDTETYAGEFTGEDEFEGRYIYAYQIFNDIEGYSELAVAYFAILGIEGNTMDDTTSQDDQQGGIEPSSIPKEGTWKFDGGILSVGEHSWFLVFSSNQDWTRGEYDIRQADDDLPVPTPEPATVILLGLGSIIFLIRRSPVHSAT